MSVGWKNEQDADHDKSKLKVGKSFTIFQNNDNPEKGSEDDYYWDSKIDRRNQT